MWRLEIRTSSPACPGEVLFAGDVPDDLRGLGMALALVLHRHFVFRIAQIRLTYDAGMQLCGHVQFRFGQTGIFQRQPQPGFRRRIGSYPCLFKGEPGFPDSGGSFMPVQHVRQLFQRGVWLSSAPRSRAGESAAGGPQPRSAPSMLIFREQSSHVRVRDGNQQSIEADNFVCEELAAYGPPRPVRRGMAIVSGREMWISGSSLPGRNPGNSHECEGRGVGRGRELRDQACRAGLPPRRSMAVASLGQPDAAAWDVAALGAVTAAG